MKIIITEEQYNSKIDEIFDRYIESVYPEFKSENSTLKMATDETSVYLMCNEPKSFGLRYHAIAYFTNSHRGGTYRHLYFNSDSIPENLNQVFGERWAELMLHWFNREYKKQLISMFNAIDWEINGVE